MRECPTCRGSGEVPDEPQECGATIVRGHETFTCYEKDPAHYPGSPHFFMGWGPECPACGALEEHSADCSCPDSEGGGYERWEWTADGPPVNVDAAVLRAAGGETP